MHQLQQKTIGMALLETAHCQSMAWQYTVMFWSGTSCFTGQCYMIKDVVDVYWESSTYLVRSMLSTLLLCFNVLETNGLQYRQQIESIS